MRGAVITSLDSVRTASLDSLLAPIELPPRSVEDWLSSETCVRNLKFGFFDNSGLPRESRILLFYSFETEGRLSRSGILHYNVTEERFVGPRYDQELTSAALEFLRSSGRLSHSPA